MKCPKCQFENREQTEFCLKCGGILELNCPQCGKDLQLLTEFCGNCGLRLDELPEIGKAVQEIASERKHVTVLFSDVSGYTAMTERLDPEEVKEIMSRIFGDIVQVITKYEGYIERFIGDAVMAVFGIPRAHEDDPVRAIKAAIEIHELVEDISPRLEEKVEQRVSMHSGINTGLVVTGEVDLKKGKHGITGSAVNLAARIQDLAGVGEILVGEQTYRQAEGHFNFESVAPATVRGKDEAVQTFKLLSPKERPIKVHRLSGLKADLIGREKEVAQFAEAVENIRRGKGCIFSITGDAGTGKSRLVAEYKATLDLEEILWIDGHAYSYSQNIPYFPLIDLLSRAFRIEESDNPKKVREKIEFEIEDLVGKKEGVVPYIGGLFALRYPEADDVSPEFWKSQLQDAVLVILSALARRKPTVFCLEDLHWADPSFIKLLIYVMSEIRQPAIVLLVYRPTFSLFTTHELGRINKIHREIRLQDFSPSEAQNMLESLLKTDDIPSDLRRFVQDKSEGNPFYLEELVNSLIDSGSMIRDNGRWRLIKDINEVPISTTIHGVISDRLDRLEKHTKRVLQEASVIGRNFLYEILTKVTDFKHDIDQSLKNLEQLDLIRTRSLQPDLEYTFKHALTQEAVYNGLLITERKELHERIALVMEKHFQDRLPEFYETLAYHFKQSQLIQKAVDYLISSGEKSWERYALEESHQYYIESFDLLSNKSRKTREEKALFIDLLNKWALVYDRRGDFIGLIDLFKAHEYLAESLGDKEKLGLLRAWLGYSFRQRENLKESYQYLTSALELGEEIQSRKVIAHASCWLCWTCADLGLLNEALDFGKKAQEICLLPKPDLNLYRSSLWGMGLTHYFRGEGNELDKVGEIYLSFGERLSDPRFITEGHTMFGLAELLRGDALSAIEYFQRAARTSIDPFVTYSIMLFLGMSFLSNDKPHEAQNVLEGVKGFSEKFGIETMGTPSQFFLGLVSITKGNLKQGTGICEEALRLVKENESRYRYATGEYLLGKIYAKIVQGGGPANLSFLLKNFGFLLKNVPFARQKAEKHFLKAIQVAKEIGAKGILGQACFDLGLLHKKIGRTDQAKKCLSDAVKLFEQCEAELFLSQAKNALVSLG